MTDRQGSTHDAARISAQEARRVVDSGRGIIVDVRAPEAFATAHAAGAISAPLNDLAQRLPSLPRNRELIFYCT